MKVPFGGKSWLKLAGAPEREVTVWSAASLFVHSTVLFAFGPPIITVTFLGEKVIAVSA